MKSILFNSNHQHRDNNPSYSYCYCCGMPWNMVQYKAVPTGDKRGSFATCIDCWFTSTLDELKQYYAELYIKQKESLVGTVHTMDYTLVHLLECVEKEYYHLK